jgi:ATP-dependent Clp protease ATP-binding subunit ClpC
MFERYTESARRSLFFARYESSQLGGVSIETEHLLLGLVRDGSALTMLTGLPLEGLRLDLERRALVREKVSTSVEIPFSSATKRALQFAAEEADRLLRSYIGTEHLLLGLLREEDSVAARSLAARGVRLGDVRRKAEELHGPLEASAEPVARLAFDQIKSLVEELARAPRDSPEAAALVTRIHARIDALLNGYGIR